MKKYYIKFANEYGQTIFESKSDSAKALLKRFNKAAFSSDGNMYSSFYFGKKETNITSDIEERVYNGEDI